MGHPSTWSDQLAARWPATERRRSLAAGLGFGVSGGLLALVMVGGYLGLTSPDDLVTGDLETLVILFGLPLAAGLGGAVAGGPLWWLLVERPADPPNGRGTLAGALVGILAHPLMWTIIGLIIVIGGLLASGTGGAGGDPIGDVIDGLSFLLFVSFVGVLITGIITVPVAAGTGLALSHVRKRALEPESEPSERRPQDL